MARINPYINPPHNTSASSAYDLTEEQKASLDSGITASKVAFYDDHVASTSNPHAVTKAQVGLGNVDNTSDVNKPVSTATQTALDQKQNTLVSGTNIKTINNTSIMGSGNIDISSSTTFASLTDSPYNNTLLSSALNNKQNVISAGTNINLTENGTKVNCSLQKKVENYGGDDVSLVTTGEMYTWNHKQDSLSSTQLAAVNSGVTSTTLSNINTNLVRDSGDIGNIKLLIPTAATSLNQLADKAFVNSSISNIAANYVTYNVAGDSFPTKSALTSATTFYHSGEEYTLRTNDYSLVLSDEDHDNKTTRYLYNGTSWDYQYSLNNTTFTQAQNNAINSNITAALVSSYSSHLDNTSNPHSVTASQVGLGNVNNTADVDKPISTATQTALNNKQDVLQCIILGADE